MNKSPGRSTHLRRVVPIAALAAVACAATSSAARSAPATTLCVGTKVGCYSTVQAAVNAAQDGDTIEIGPGTFAGGITIGKSVQLVGVSAAATVVRGGGPVILIGELLGPTQPTVAISRMTITGGLNDSEGVAAGGGVAIPFAGFGVQGATVTISDSIITRNRATPRTLIPPGLFCGSKPCAVAWGGGIDSSGALTLTNTLVTDNVAGSTQTDGSDATIAEGGGVRNHPGGTLTLRRSVVSGNRAATTAPNGRSAYGGGIRDDGILAIDDSVIDGNSAAVSSSVPSSFPFDVEQEADGGGIFSNGSAAIARTTISGNSVSSSNAGGDAQALAGGIDADFLLLVESSVDHNSVTATVPASSGFLAGAVFGGVKVGGDVTIRNGRIVGNTLSAVSAGGGANAAGAGIANLSGRLTLERTLVTGNRGTAIGLGGLVLGGGILNIDFGGGPPQLTVSDSAVTANALTGSPGITPQGGGIFSADIFTGDPVPFTLTSTVLAGNKPDQCVGC